METPRQYALRVGIALLLSAITVSAGADPIPQDWLKNVQTGCVSACTQQQFSAASCQTTCACVAQRFAAQLDKNAFQTMDAAARNRQALPPALQARIDAIQDSCAAPQ
jgi:hypothetical protein